MEGSIPVGRTPRVYEKENAAKIEQRKWCRFSVLEGESHTDQLKRKT